MCPPALLTRPVLLADIVESRSISRLRPFRDRKLELISTSHLTDGIVETPYAVTAGDEFQNILVGPAKVPRAVFELRRHFQPADLWIAVGIGTVRSVPRGDEPVNVAGMGEAFEYARKAMKELKHRKTHKYRYLTMIRSTDGFSDQLINLVYRLHDTLLQRITDRQWETIRVQSETKSQDQTAFELGLDESTVSRNLRRGFYWQIEDTVNTLEGEFQNRFE